MSDFQIIQETLKQAVRRRRRYQAWRGLWWGLLLGTVIWVLLLGFYKILPIPYQWVAWGGYFTGATALGGAVLGWCRKVTLQEMARWVDQNQALHERLSTALERASSTDASDHWSQLVVQDAARHAKGVDLKRLLPLRLPRPAQWVLLTLVLGVGLGFVPKYRSEAYRERQEQREAMKEAGHKMAKIIRRELDSRSALQESTKASMEDAAKLGDQLKQAKLKRVDALKKLAKAGDKLKQEAKKLAKDPALQRMQRSARQNSGSKASASQLQKRMEALKKKLGDKGANSEQLQAIRKKLEQLQKAAAAMQGNNSAQAAQTKKNIRQSLSNLQSRLQNMGQSLPSLQAAMKALKSSEVDRVLSEMDQAINDLQSLEEMAKALQKMQSKMEKMGKTLAEQLKRGQANTAQQTLSQMQQKLNQGDLSRAERKKMMEEIKKAIKPAGIYGKAGKHLKQALQQMQQKQNSQAAKSLAKAAKELEKMGQQLANMKSLAKALQALQTAKMCVGNCQKWGKCKGMAKKWSMFSKKGGTGVGLWGPDAQNQKWLKNVPKTGNPPKSHLNRPNMKPRGVTEREAKLNENLTPSKVKGRFSKGGQMPSVRLEGVSIKGESSVDFQEVLSKAQSEAESALSQEKVPQAHRDRVRNYFDNLK